MIKRGLLAFAIFVFAFSFTALAQPGRREFTEEAKPFITELKEHFGSDRRPEIQQVVTTFAELWESKQFSDEEQAKIMEFCNTLLRQRMKLHPEFSAYLRTLNAYKSHKLAAEKFNQYHDVADQILSKSKKDFLDFTLTCQSLFEDLTLFSNPAKTWKVSNDDYKISFGKDPIITFRSSDLLMFTKGDTLGMFQTSGEYHPTDNKWYGKGGQVYWTRVGFAKERTYAKLKKYNVNLQNSDYSADSAEFYFPQVFANKAILGKLQDKAMTEYQGAGSSYPRFRSYQAFFEIKNIFKNIDYRGGFALEGAQIIGTGNDSVRASIVIRQNGRIVFRALSNAFVMEPEKIVSSKAAVALYVDKDSVFHSQVLFNYIEKSRILTLSRDNTGLYTAPFFNSYHQLEFQPANLVWKIDEPQVQFRNVANPEGAIPFESAQLFKEPNYIRQQGILGYNPLEKIKKFVEGGSRIITEKELETAFGNKIEYLNNMLFQLANAGFIFYDMEGHKVVIKDKLIHYVDAFKQKADFDNISFESVISKLPNAVLDLKTYDFVLQGVPKVNLSDSQYTYLVPYDQKVIFKKGLDMAFGGHVHSGRFDFYGKDFTFNYNKFNITLANVDSVKFKFPEYDSTGKKELGLRTVQNTIQNVNGFLYIDEPNNKSGKKPVAKYPIFECNKESFVYYDKPSIYNAVYKRDRFFFKVDPFTIQNLDKFTAQGLQFPGALTSADITPVIRNPLTIQEDFSLGFKVKSPEPAGYTLYKGKGTGKGQFLLSNQGLRAEGEVAYLVSKTVSKKFIFFPDSMNTNCESFDIPEMAGGKYPPVAAKGTFNNWRPYKDSMYVYKGKNPMSVYNGKIDFSGSFILTPVELVGTGAMAYQDLNITSNAFAFLPKNIKTKEGDVAIKSGSSSRAALQAENVNVDLDLTKDFGRFAANADTGRVFLPTNRFATTLNNFTYDIAKKQVDFTKSAGQSDDDAYFVSNNPDQQNLKFNSKKASYNINQQSIKAQDVPFLTVADSRIYTPNQEVNIEKEGNIGSIKGVEIITDSESENHKIYNAFVNIFSQNKFTGYGDYDYVDKREQKFKITFSDIRINETGQTVARGTVSDTQKFFLDKNLKFSGTVNLLSTRKELNFDGLVLATHENKELGTEGVKINEIINPKAVVLAVAEPVGKDTKPLYSGTFISAETNKMYNLLFGKMKSPLDLPVFTTTGTLLYNDQTDEFTYGPKEKVAPETAEEEVREGDVIRFNKGKNLFHTEGVYNYGINMKHVALNSAGNFTYDYTKGTNEFNLAMTVNFPMGADAGKMLVDSMLEAGTNLEDVENSKDEILTAFSMMVKERKEKEKVLADLASGVARTSGILERTMVLTELKMSWNDTTNSFVSLGKIGLANLMNNMINKRMDGVMELARNKEGDRFSMLFEPTPGSYVYFGYVNGDMFYLGSDLTFVDKVTATASKVEKGNKGYRLKLGSMNDIATLYQKKKKI